jgi:hypothetical protein
MLLPLLAIPAEGGILFGRKQNKVSPNERVPQLINIVKSDKDEGKRTKAAEELRNFDPATFPDIIPVLLDVLQNDKKPVVRAEVIQTLCKFRPVNQQVGLALEQTVAKDPSMRVRLQARSSLLQYQWAGYRTSGKNEPPPLEKTKVTPIGPEKSLPPPINTKDSAPPSSRGFFPSRLFPSKSTTATLPVDASGRLVPVPVETGSGLRPVPPTPPRKPTTNEPPLAQPEQISAPVPTPTPIPAPPPAESGPSLGP